MRDKRGNNIDIMIERGYSGNYKKKNKMTERDEDVARVHARERER